MPDEVRPPVEDRRQRRARGGFYTPPEVARYLVVRALDARESSPPADPQGPPRVLDPACGDGVFLRCALEELLRRRAAPEQRSGACFEEFALRVMREQLFGIDRDAQAVRAARRSLTEVLRLNTVKATSAWNAQIEAEIESVLAANLRQGDALLDPLLESRIRSTPDCRPGTNRHRDTLPGNLARPVFSAPFDVILANPPYLNIRLLSKYLDAQGKRDLQARFSCATGAYDVYVLFVELAWHLLSVGGVCGLVVPNKIGSAQYATACRKLLLERTRILEIVDAADLPLFPGTGIYPYLMLWRKEPAARGHRVRVRRPRELAGLHRSEPAALLPQSRWKPASGFPLEEVLDIQQRVPTAPLDRCARLESGTTGFQAGRLAGQLLEASDARDRGLSEEDWFAFIVSGNIDRYRVRRGPLRFMKRRFQCPVLPRAAPLLSAAKQRLFRGEKIVVSGMTRRLEAARDPGGLALGVQVYAVVPDNVSPLYLLALLNSKLLSHWFRTQFSAKRLGGGYLGINKAQLGCLPIRRIRRGAAEDEDLYRRLLQRTGVLQSLRAAGEYRDEAENPAELERAEREVDQIVYALYALRDDEIRRVEEGIF